MKVLMINGSPHPAGCTATALNEVADTLHKHGIETEILYLGNKPVAGCIACMKCFETGHCFRDDAVKDIQQRLDEFDAIVLGSPVYYSQPTGQITSFCQRLFFCKEGEMAGKLGASVVSCRRGELRPPLSNSTSISQSAIFRLYHRNTGTQYTASLLTMYGRIKRTPDHALTWRKYGMDA